MENRNSKNDTPINYSYEFDNNTSNSSNYDIKNHNLYDLESEQPYIKIKQVVYLSKINL